MKKFFLIALLLISLTFYGCNSNDNLKTIDKISSTIKNVQEVVSTINTLPKEYLSAKQASINCDENFEEGTGYNGSTFTSVKNCCDDRNNLYIIQNITNINSNTVYLVSCVNSKSSNLLAMCNLFENSNNKLKESHVEAISNLCDSISHNIDYIKNNNYNYSNFTYDNLYFNRNYAETINNLEAKNSCLSGICFGIDNIYDILADYNFNETKDKTKATSKTWSNIDTYRNINNKTNVNNASINNNNIYPNNQYNNPNYSYGHGGTNPYYNFGYGRFGFGGYGGINGFGRYPYSPYSNYNPYMPNIDTFGTYTNVDTYQNYIDNQDNNQNNYNVERIDDKNVDDEQKDEYNYKPYLPKEKCQNCNNEDNEYLFSSKVNQNISNEIVENKVYLKK